MITVTKLDTGGYEIQEGIGEPTYVSELGYDTISGQLVVTNKCGSAESKPYDPSQWTIVCEGISSETGFTSNLEVVKALDGLCVGFGKVCSTGGGTTPTTPIYGSNLQLLQSGDLFTTISNTTTEEVFNQATDGIQDGIYEIKVSYFWNVNNIRQDIETFFYINTVGVGLRNGLIHKQEPKDASGNFNGTQSLQQYVYEKTFYYTKNTGGLSPLDIDLNFRTTGSARASIWEPSIKIFRIQ